MRHRKPTHATIRIARALRRRMTLPEVLLWQALRTRPDGVKFRRQHPCGAYVLDFYCAAARLAIEVDGAVHDAPAQIRHDAARDAWLESAGIAVLRVPARAVLRDLPGVVAGILAARRARVSLHDATAS